MYNYYLKIKILYNFNLTFIIHTSNQIIDFKLSIFSIVLYYLFIIISCSRIVIWYGTSSYGLSFSDIFIILMNIISNILFNYLLINIRVNFYNYFITFYKRKWHLCIIKVLIMGTINCTSISYHIASMFFRRSVYFITFTFYAIFYGNSLFYYKK